MQISRIRLSRKALASDIQRMPFRFAAAQRDQPLLFEPLKNGSIFGELESTLTASLEMLDQTLPNVPVDLPVGGLRISDGKVVLPASQLPVDFADEFCDRFVALPAVC